jgi:hypothetical protein
MSILDTFFIMFDVDAGKLEDGIEKSKKKTSELEKALKQVEDQGGKLGKSFSNMLKEAGGAVAAALSVAAIGYGIKVSADYADQLGKTADALDVNIEELSAWSDVVSMSGGTAEGFKASLGNLTQQFADIKAKGTSESLVFFQQLGIELEDSEGKMKGVMDVLPELAEKFEGLSKAESLGLGRKLGLDEGTIMTLQSGRRAVEDMVAKQKELGAVTAHQAKVSAEFNDAISQLSFTFRGLFLSIGESVLPAFQSLIQWGEKIVIFFKKHSDFITGLFIALGVAVAVYLTPPLMAAAAAALTAFAPFLLIGAIVASVIGVFALLYDEITNFIEGNNSMIGEISKKWPIVGEVAMGIVEALKFLWTWAKAVFGLLGDLIMDPANAWDNFTSKVDKGIVDLRKAFPPFFDLIDMIGEKFEDMGQFVADVFNAIVKIIMDSIGAVSGAVESVKSFFGFEPEKKEEAPEEKGIPKNQKTIEVQNQEPSTFMKLLGITQEKKEQLIPAVQSAYQPAMQTMQAASSFPLNNITSSAITNSTTTNAKSTNVSVAKIEIKTQASDADGIAKTIGNRLHDEIKKATSGYDDGVAI